MGISISVFSLTEVLPRKRTFSFEVLTQQHTREESKDFFPTKVSAK